MFQKLKSIVLLFLREKCRKIVKEPGKLRETMQFISFFDSCVTIFQISCIFCRERTRVQEQKHTLLRNLKRSRLLLLAQNGFCSNGSRDKHDNKV